MNSAIMSAGEVGMSTGLGYTAPGSSSRPTEECTPRRKAADELEIRIEFGYASSSLLDCTDGHRGGLHLLFSQQPKHTIYVPRTVPETSPAAPTDMRYLIKWLKGNLLSEREEMFGEGDGVCVAGYILEALC
jgi:ubiquitin related modifier 1